MNYAKLERLALKARESRTPLNTESVWKLLSDSWDAAEIIDTQRQPWTSVLSVILGFFCFLTVMGTIGGTLWSLTSWDWRFANGAFLSSVSLSVMALLAYYIPGLVHVLRTAKPESTSSECSPSAVIPRYLTTRIDELEREVIGNGSPYALTLERVRRANEKALALREQLDVRLSVYNAEYLRGTRERIHVVVERTERSLQMLASFRAKVEAFLQECRASVTGIEPSLRDIELVRQVNDLARLTPVLEQKASEVVASAVAKLQTRMVGVRVDIEQRFGSDGIPLSDLLAVDPDPAREHDALRALADLDRRIETFDPDRLLTSV